MNRVIKICRGLPSYCKEQEVYYNKCVQIKRGGDSLANKKEITNPCTTLNFKGTFLVHFLLYY